VRRVLLLLAALGALTALLLTRHELPSSAAAATRTRPNVLIVETDDQTLAELSVLPNVRRLIGDQGVAFDRSFVSHSLCCPSRATLLTGQYAHNHGVRGNDPPTGGYYTLDSSSTVAVWLQRAGYYTVHLGKYLNGYGTQSPNEIPPGWSEWHGLVDPSTYRYYGYTLNEGGTLGTYCADRSPACYQTDEFRAKADGILRSRAGKGQPFFMWLAFVADHAGGPKEAGDPASIPTPVVPPRFRDALENVRMPLPPSFNEADVSDKPAFVQRLPQFTRADFDAIQESWKQRRESLLAVDEAVRSIVQTLRDTGQLDSTLILFTSDNGFLHGEHRLRYGKIVLYEPSIRVPLLLRGPGIPKGVHRSQLVANIDYAPTILDAAGVKPGRVEDGVSLLPLARDSGKELGRDLLIENGPFRHYDAIRTRNWLYAEHETGERELYDLSRDPYELRSLHADPRYARLRGALAQRLHVLVTCTGSTCRERPSMTLRLRCLGSGAVEARVVGSGVVGVSFRVNGRPVAVDRKAPFGLTIGARRFRRGQNLVRARVSVRFDRLVTKDVPISVCP
jgi:N-acetylglucosamine-6-sulfatase